jgi:hypothetical protein
VRGEKENRQPRRSSPLEAFPPVVTSAVSLPPSVRRLGRCQSLARALMRSGQSAARQRHAPPFFPFTRVSDAAKEGRVDGRVVDGAGGVAGRQARRTCRCESAQPRAAGSCLASHPLSSPRPRPPLSDLRRRLSHSAPCRRHREPVSSRPSSGPTPRRRARRRLRATRPRAGARQPTPRTRSPGRSCSLCSARARLGRTRSTTTRFVPERRRPRGTPHRR